MTAPIWFGSDGVRLLEVARSGHGAELKIDLAVPSAIDSRCRYTLLDLQSLDLALGAPASEHITEQSIESAAELRAHGRDAAGETYDLSTYRGDLEALEERLGRKASAYERTELERLIRAELKEPSR